MYSIGNNGARCSTGTLGSAPLCLPLLSYDPDYGYIQTPTFYVVPGPMKACSSRLISMDSMSFSDLVHFLFRLKPKKNHFVNSIFIVIRRFSE